jgi:hypothetical protein
MLRFVRNGVGFGKTEPTLLVVSGEKQNMIFVRPSTTSAVGFSSIYSLLHFFRRLDRSKGQNLTSQNSKNFFIFFQKPIDKSLGLCYNNIRKREKERGKQQ